MAGAACPPRGPLGLGGRLGALARAVPRAAYAGGRAGWARPPPRPRHWAAAAAAGEEAGAGAGAGAYTVTTPLYYANASPHMGSAYPTIAADALCRYARMRGREVHFVTGTDEHGEKIALSAEARGLAPRDHVDALAEEFKALWEALDIRYDHFVRTTNPRHEALVQEVVERVRARGDIYQDSYEGYYCVGCEEFKAEKDMEPGNVCPIHKKPCEPRGEMNYFFKLSKYQAAIEDLLEARPDFIQPEARRNEVLGWVKEGLRDFSISRAAVEWGIPMPGDASQTVYVWFDALLGYVSALLPEGAGLADAEAHGWPAAVHIVGKDILRFHCVYWPAMLMSAGLPLPRGIYGHGFLTKDGLKMGKSLGNVLEPTELVAKYGPDAVRYFFMKEIEFGNDGDFSEERFIDMVNANLANDVGNCLNRTLNLLKKNCGSVVPCDAADIPPDHPLRAAAAEHFPDCGPAYEALRFDRALEAALKVSGACNLYLSDTAPWTAFKQGDAAAQAEAARTLVAVLEALRVVAIMLNPVTPDLSAKVYGQLGFGAEYATLAWGDAEWGALRAGHAISKPKPVFQRFEKEEMMAGSTLARVEAGAAPGGGAAAATPQQLEEAENAVAEQGAVVKSLKAQGMTNSSPEVKAAVKVLLERKAALEQLQPQVPA